MSFKRKKFFLMNLSLIFFLVSTNFKSNETKMSNLEFGEISLIRYKKNAWEIVNENYEAHNSQNKKKDQPINFSWYKFDLIYDIPFSSQISQLNLAVFIIVVLICVIISLVCCYYSVPKEEDYVRNGQGTIYFENEKRPEEYIPIYKKNAEIRRYITTGVFTRSETGNTT